MITTRNYRHELRVLDELLITFLETLPQEDWNKKTVAGNWTIKDVAAHLLDGNLRILSSLRDQHAEEKVNITSYQDLVAYLNRLNADWVQAMKRISPQVLLELLRISGKEYCDYYDTLNLQDFAPFSVAWAGEEKSYNSFHIAREFTEKFHHQQQIRDAVGDQTLLIHPYYHDFLSILVLGMPHALRAVNVPEQTVLRLNIKGFQTFGIDFRYSGGSWHILEQTGTAFAGSATIPDTLAWKLFTKSIRPEGIVNNVVIEGDKNLAINLLNLIAVMA